MRIGLMLLNGGCAHTDYSVGGRPHNYEPQRNTGE